jgi:prephenate dehydratase
MNATIDPGARLDSQAEGKHVRAAYQGEPGANSEVAAFGYFGLEVEPVPCYSFATLFDAVLTGAVDAGVLPIENSLAGSVIESYDLLIRHPVFITGELYQQVRHHLLALPGVELGDVRRVISHPQALAQSADFLQNHPNLVPEPAFDTAGAAKLIAEARQRDAAAIATSLAADRYGLHVLKHDIQSNSENYTRMVIIERKESAPRGVEQLKTSVFAGLRHERGSLATLLDVLQRAGMNLTKIESRPIVGRPWEYLFYLDWEGRLDDWAQEDARRSTSWWKLLGVYPRGSVIPAP